MKRSAAFFLVALLFLGTNTASAMLEVWIDLSGLGDREIELEVALYDNSGVVGDSWVFVDNIAVSSAPADLPTGLDFSTAAAVAGSIEGVGGGAARIGEQEGLSPVMFRRSYSISSGDMLTFQFGMNASTTAGYWGLDELVFSILDPSTGAPLLPGLTEGMGDLLAITAGGIQHTEHVTVIPEPATLLFGILGIAFLRRRKNA